MRDLVVGDAWRHVDIIKMETAVIIAAAVLALAGCDRYATRTFGGETKINIPTGTQLVSMTWKDNDLWYLYYAPKPIAVCSKSRQLLV